MSQGKQTAAWNSVERERRWTHRGVEVLEDESDDYQSSSNSTAQAEKILAEDPPGRPSRGDVFIAVMGVTGAGKSTFISRLTDEPVEIGHDLISTTKHVRMHGFQLRDRRRGWLIDTPGFDDTSRSDTDILREVAFYLAKMYEQGILLSGIIYLHRITDPRMPGSALKNLKVLQQLCGRAALPNVRLVTTRWNEVRRGDGGFEQAVQRETELMASDKFWAGMIRDGCRVMRHTGDANSALEIVSTLSEGGYKAPLLIQVEMIEHRIELDQTAAGQLLTREHDELRQKYEAEIQELHESKEEALRDQDHMAAAAMEIQEREYEALKASLASADQGLKVSFNDLNAQKSHELSRQGQVGTNPDDQVDQGLKSDIKFLELSMAEMQDRMERREREHQAQIARMRNDSRIQTAQQRRHMEEQIQALTRGFESEKEKQKRLFLQKSRPKPKWYWVSDKWDWLF